MSFLINIPILVTICLSLIKLPGDDYISWNEKTKLRWADFKGIPQVIDSVFEAFTTSSIHSSYHPVDLNTMQYEISAVFNETKSFYKSDTSKYLLSHEQGHFDLTEIYARKLRQDLIKQDLRLTNYQGVFDSLYEQVHSELNKSQALYDSETDHSRNLDQQKKWNEKIKNDLAQLKAFCNPVFTIELK